MRMMLLLRKLAKQKKKKPDGYKDNLVALFVNSGTADCESLQGIYGPKVESNQTDLAYLKKSNRYHENDEMYGK